MIRTRKASARFLSALLCLVMMLTLLPTVAFAASGSGTESDPYVATTYNELRNLMENAPSDGTSCYIKLGNDTLDSSGRDDYYLRAYHKTNIVLDLAGHRIIRTGVTNDFCVIAMYGGSLTINDSVGGGWVSASMNGMSSVNTAIYTYSFNGNNLTINGGEFTGSGYGIRLTHCTAVINGGTFRSFEASEQSYAALFEVDSQNNTHVTINGGTFGNADSMKPTIGIRDADVALNNCTAYYGMYSLDGSWPSIKAGTTVTVDGVPSTSQGLRLWGNIKRTGAKLVISTEVAPDAPTGVTATAGDKSATVSFTPPANNGGAAITEYAVTANPGGKTATGTGSPITVTGLANGVNYTFTVKATNSAGTSAASSASNSVKPMLKVELVDASIPAPKAGKTPYNNFDDGDGWVRWADTIIWTPYNKPFKSSTAYTATMEILADINSSDVFISEFTADTEWKINGETVTPDSWDAHSAIFTVTFPATKALDNISITTAPTTTSYTVGNSFNPAGMVVKAAYEDDATQYPVTGYTVTDGASLTSGQSTVTISYTEGGVTKTTTQAITVTTSSKNLTGISVTTVPTKTTYTAGENFDTAGMVVTAAYSDAESAPITGYTVTDGTDLTAGKATVTISYTENGVTKTTTQAITVNAAPAGLTFTDNASYDIPASKVGTAITPIDVSSGVNGGTMPYTFTAVNLPNGITISDAGTISGTPTTANAAETAVIKVTDNAGAVKTINIGVGKITNLPDAPTNVVATAGNGLATVSFIPPTNDGGEAITNYTVTSSGGQTATGTGSPIVVTGLTNGTAYTFTVKATNSVGDSTASAPSNSVTPTTADTYGIALDTAGTYTFTAATVGYGAQTAKTVTVNSIGTAATGNLTVALSGTNASSFTLNKTSISSIAAGGSDTFTIVPNTGLAVGTYTATVTVNGGAVTAQSFDVSFKVNSAGSGTGGGGTSYTYYTITATAGAGGSIAPSGSSSVREGTDKAYTITPNTGYVISDVLVDGRSVGAVKTYTFDNVKKAHTISVTFKAGGHSNPQTGVDMDFTDVKDSDWFYEDVAYVFAEGLMNGTSATTFSPYANTTRGMIVTILYRLAGAPAVSGTNPFDDVKPGSYYEDAITWAAADKIVGGYGNGKFGPDDNITREQMAAILYRYAQFKGYDVSVGEDTNILSYTDAEGVGEWAIPSMQWACGAGLINGSAGKLMPQGEATRAQVAAILHRFCENIVK